MIKNYHLLDRLLPPTLWKQCSPARKPPLVGPGKLPDRLSHGGHLLSWDIRISDPRPRGTGNRFKQTFITRCIRNRGWLVTRLDNVNSGYLASATSGPETQGSAADAPGKVELHVFSSAVFMSDQYPHGLQYPLETYISVSSICIFTKHAVCPMSLTSLTTSACSLKPIS